MQFIMLLTSLLIAFCTRTAAEERNQGYIRNYTLGDEVSTLGSTLNIATTSSFTVHRSVSLTKCSALCHGVCACFGFNPKRRECRIHQICNPSDMNIGETGWRYYSPVGMLSFILHVTHMKYLKLSKYLKLPQKVWNYIRNIALVFSIFGHIDIFNKSLNPPTGCKIRY
jgi:hypothetical protein